MSRNIIFFTPYCLMLLMISCDASAYERETHFSISERAVVRSVLERNNQFLDSIGVNKNGKFKSRYANKFSNLQGLVALGSVLEDGFIPCIGGSGGIRVSHHFYDPRYDRQLYPAPPLTTPEKSPDWALEDKNNMENQYFSMRDGREYYYAGLTKELASERGQNYVDMFQTMGHLVHHIQDMAQPQHTRNDYHFNISECIDKNLYFEHRSLREIYTNKLNQEGELNSYLFVPDDIENVRFERPRSYWATKEGIGGTGKGLAEYTNNNFVSFGTNFLVENGVLAQNSEYSLPIPEGPADDSYQLHENIEEIVKDPRELCHKGPTGSGTIYCIGGEIIFYKTTVQDNQTNTVQINQRASTLSLLNYDLEKYGHFVEYDLYNDPNLLVSTEKLFTITRFNIESALEYLMPKAITYSAGLIDYFFRARLFSILSEKVDFYSLKVKNVGNAPLSGEFQLYYNDSNDDRHLLYTKENETIYPKDQAISPSGPNPTTLTFNITNPPDDLNKNEPYVVVFKGDTRFQENDGPVQFEPAVTGFVLDNRKLAYSKSTGDVRKINPETGSAKSHVGQFSGSSRVKKNPLNADLAIVFHPFKNDVQVIDYSLNKTATVTMDPLAARWLVSARWVDGKVMVATLGVHGPTTRYRYKIYRIKPEHALELEREGNNEFENGEFEALGGVRSWGHWPGEESEYFDLGYGPYVNWYSFDILPDGTMITLLNKWGWDNTQNATSKTYYTVLNCTNQVLATEKSSTTSTFVDMRVQKVDLDGNVVNEDLNTHHNQNYVSEYHYSAPKSPQEPGPCSRGNLSKKVFSDNRDWRYILHLDVKPNEEIAEVVETGSYTGNQTWTPEAGWIKYDVGTKEYTIDGHQIDTGKYLLVQDGNQNIEEEEGVQFWDLRYDNTGVPYGIWTRERWWFDEPESTYHHDTEVIFGNARKRNRLLTNRHDYFEYGPPLEYADVVADPYRKGVAALLKVRDSSFYGDYAYDVEETEHVRYEGEISVDLRKDYVEEFAGVTSLQFLP